MGDIELLKIGAKQDGHSLGFASEEAKSNPGLIRVAMDNKWRAIEHAITPVEVLYSKSFDPKPTRLFWKGITGEFPPRRVKNPVRRPSISEIIPRSIATFGDAVALAEEKQRKLDEIRAKLEGEDPDSDKDKKKKKKKKDKDKDKKEKEKDKDNSAGRT